VTRRTVREIGWPVHLAESDRQKTAPEAVLRFFSATSGFTQRLGSSPEDGGAGARVVWHDDGTSHRDWPSRCSSTFRYISSPGRPPDISVPIPGLVPRAAAVRGGNPRSLPASRDVSATVPKLLHLLFSRWISCSCCQALLEFLLQTVRSLPYLLTLVVVLGLLPLAQHPVRFQPRGRLVYGPCGGMASTMPAP